MKTTTNILSAMQTSAQSIKANMADSLTKRSAVQSYQTDSRSQDSFDSALEQARSNDASQSQKAAASDEQDASVTASDQTKPAADTKDVSAADDTAAKPAAKAKTAKTDNAKDTDEAKAADDAASSDDTKADEPATGAKTVNANAGLNALLLALAGNAGVQTQTSAGKTEAAVPTTGTTAAAGQANSQETVTAALDALLPQDAAATAQATQNQQLLDMLGGTNTQAASGQLAAAPELTKLAQAALTQNADTAAVLSTDGKAAGTAATLNPLSTAAETKAAAGQGNAKAEFTADTTAKNLFSGIPLTVEDRSQTAGNGQQQTAGDMLKKQAGQQAQPALTQADGKMVQQGDQLPEEADFDTTVLTAPAADTTDVTSQASVQAGTFQPTTDLSAMNPASEASTVQQPQTEYDIPKQIVEQAKLIRSVEDTQMVIKLKPEHLGELTLKVSVGTDGAINASFHSDNAQVRGIIESSMVQLKQELQAQGLKVDNVGVYAGLSQDFFNENQAGQQGYPQQSTSAHSQKLDMEAFTEDADAVALAATANAAGASGSITETGVDYRI